MLIHHLLPSGIRWDSLFPLTASHKASPETAMSTQKNIRRSHVAAFPKFIGIFSIQADITG